MMYTPYVIEVPSLRVEDSRTPAGKMRREQRRLAAAERRVRGWS